MLSVLIIDRMGKTFFKKKLVEINLATGFAHIIKACQVACSERLKNEQNFISKFNLPFSCFRIYYAITAFQS